MKNTLTTLLCVLLCLALTAGAICLGARNGWMKERQEAISVSLGGEEAVSFEERAMDAANLHVVAKRHLSAEDERLTRLQSLRSVLTSAQADDSDKAQADIALTALASELGQALPLMDSVKQSPRDQVYITTLTRTLTHGRDAVAYAVSAQDFNDRLSSSLTGRLAALLGVEPIDIP